MTKQLTLPGLVARAPTLEPEPPPPSPLPAQERYWLQVRVDGRWHVVGTYPRQEAVRRALHRAASVADAPTAIVLWLVEGSGKGLAETPRLRLVPRTGRATGHLADLWRRACDKLADLRRDAVVWCLLDELPRTTDELCVAYARHVGMRWVLRAVSPQTAQEVDRQELQAPLLRTAEALGATLEGDGGALRWTLGSG